MKTDMKKTISHILTACAALLLLTACMDDGYDTPQTDTNDVTGTLQGETNYSIARLKQDKAALFSQTNAFEKVDEDLILEGVVCANDISGNLYQTVLLRDIDENAGTDQCLVLAIKNTCLYPYFALGQRLRVNLKGLYVGVYSKVPKIGQPYYTSSGNLRLGPILLQLCKTNVELVGKPNPNAPELVPVELDDDWLRATANRTPANSPMLATVSGSIAEVEGDKKNQADVGEVTGLKEPLPKILGPEELRDAGYGVDRTIQLQSNTSKVTLRTSTQNDISFLPVPEGIHKFTGMLTYYSNWQIQLRTTADIE